MSDTTDDLDWYEGEDEMPRSYVHLDVEEIIGETEKAFLLVFDDWEGEFWIPKSHIADAGDYNKGDKGICMSLTEWIAEQNGLTE